MNNVENIKYMFYNCSQLTNLPDISKWETDKVINIDYMFGNCSSLIALPDITKWKGKNIICDDTIFKGCFSLLLIPDISKWNIKSISIFDTSKSNSNSLYKDINFINFNQDTKSISFQYMGIEKAFEDNDYSYIDNSESFYKSSLKI